MRLMKFAVIGAAVVIGVSYLLNEKKESSFIDDLKDNAPDLLDKAKKLISKFGDQVKSDIS
jgi:hypothetical protein